MGSDDEKKKLKRRIYLMCGVLAVALIVLVVSLVSGDKVDLVSTDSGLTITGDAVPEKDTGVGAGGGIENGTGQEEAVTAWVDLETLQKEILSIVRNENYAWGSMYRGSLLLPAGFSQLFIPECYYIMEISYDEISVGDVAVGDGITGICVGFISAEPVFAYVADKTVYDYGYGAVCLGYSKVHNNRTLAGMYPANFTTFYDCYSSAGAADLFNAKMTELTENTPWYADAVYGYGRLFSDNKAELIASLIPDDALEQSNMKVHEEAFFRFVENFAESKGCPPGAYSFHVTKKVYEGEDSVTLQIACVSLEPATYLEKYGEWYITMYPDSKYSPCGPKLSEYADECGFVRAKEITVGKDEETGNIVVEEKELVYGVTTDEDGRPNIRGEDGSIIYLDTIRPKN